MCTLLLQCSHMSKHVSHGVCGPQGLRMWICGTPVLTVVCMSHKHLDPYFLYCGYIHVPPQFSVCFCALHTVPKGLARVPVSWSPHFCSQTFYTWVLEAKGSWRLILGQVAGDLQFWKQTVKI